MIGGMHPTITKKRLRGEGGVLQQQVLPTNMYRMAADIRCTRQEVHVCNTMPAVQKARSTSTGHQVQRTQKRACACWSRALRKHRSYSSLPANMYHTRTRLPFGIVVDLIEIPGVP